MPSAAGRSWMMGPEQWLARYGVLLRTAKQLRDDGHHEAAVVTAQTACEVCTEILLTEIFKHRSIEYLSDPIDRLLPNYNLGNERVRRIYEATANDPITTASDRWSRFKQHVEKRNDVVHHGVEGTRAEADASIAVVEEIIEHMLRHYSATWHSS